MAVRLLFDENLAPRLVRDVAEVFPGSRHVEDLGLASADDEAVWCSGFASATVRHWKSAQSYVTRDIEEFAADAHTALMVLTSRE